ncbi:hypothetical protein NFI96_009270 [Prochilodus magdalenae]|nr:hypothetical protein NFI96_009270 [Prochilodus magdalenae]
MADSQHRPLRPLTLVLRPQPGYPPPREHNLYPSRRRPYSPCWRTPSFGDETRRENERESAAIVVKRRPFWLNESFRPLEADNGHRSQDGGHRQRNHVHPYMLMVFPGAERIFQPDNAACHMPRNVQHGLEEPDRDIQDHCSTVGMFATDGATAEVCVSASACLMALQDVCGFQEMALCHPARLPIYSDDTALSTYPAGRIKATWGRPFGADDGSPLYLSLPPQRSLGRSRGRRLSSSLTTIQCPVTLSHGTTTLGFAFQGGVIAAADTRASCAGLVACPAAQKIMPIHSHLVVTTSGSGADCMLWERILTREIRLYQLRHGRRLSVFAAAKLLSFMLRPFKGTEVCVAATLCGWDGDDTRADRANRWKADEREMDSAAPGPSLAGEPSASTSRAGLGMAIGADLSTSKTPTSGQADVISEEASGDVPQGGSDQVPAAGLQGPRVCYVCSDGLVLKGELMSVGSGSPYAYSILDDGWRWSMSVDEAVALAREAVYRATHRDAYSGNHVDMFHITERGWSRRHREDLKDEYYRERRRKKEMMQQRERTH